MLKLRNPVTLQPSSYTDDKGKIVKPESFQLQTLYISYIDRPYQRMYSLRIERVPGQIDLFTGEEYDQAISKDMANQKLDTLMGNDPQGFLQKYFPKALENHPNGPGTILHGFLKKIGITSTPTCSCNMRAIEMNEKGPEWCQENIDTIFEWLKEEADKRKYVYQDWCIKALINRSIKRAIKKCENTTSAS